MERGAEIYQAMPLTERELAMSAAQYWGPAEDWPDWFDCLDAAR